MDISIQKVWTIDNIKLLLNEKQKNKQLINSIFDNKWNQDFVFALDMESWLKFACEIHNIKIVKKLLDIELKSSSDWNRILLSASRNGRLETVKTFCQVQFSFLCVHRCYYDMAIYLACENGYMDIVSCLFEIADTPNNRIIASYIALKNGHMNIVNLLNSFVSQ